MFILLMLAAVTTAVGGPLAYDNFNSYTVGQTLITRTYWSELFASEDATITSALTYPGMGNSVVAPSSNYASSKMAIVSGTIDLTTDTVYITGLLKVVGATTGADGLYLGLANSNTAKAEMRFYPAPESNSILTFAHPGTGTSASTNHPLAASDDPNSFEVGKTYLCVIKMTPVNSTTVDLKVGFAEFTGYPIATDEASTIKYQVSITDFNVTGFTSYGSVLFYPRGANVLVDHVFVGETWADVQNPQPYVPPVYNELAGYWPMDQDHGKIAPDMSAYGNDGTTTSNVLWDWGKVAAAADPGSYFTTGLTQVAGTGLTVAGWFKPTATATGYRGAFATRGIADDTGAGQNWGIAFDNDHWECRTSGEATDSPTILGAGDINKWYHVVQVWDGTAHTTTLYINGQVNVGPQAQAAVSLIAGCTDWPICDDLNRYFVGLVDELAIWNKAMSLADVNKLYTDGLAGIGADGSTPTAPPRLPPLDWLDPDTLTGGDVIFSKEPGLGNGGFEDLFEYYEAHEDYVEQDPNLPFRIFCEGRLTPAENYCSIDDGGWTATVIDQGSELNPAGWETPKYNLSGYPSHQYEGDTGFLIQTYQEVELVSDYGVDATMLADGDSLAIEWFSRETSDNYGTVITAYLIFDKGLGTEHEVEVGSLYEQSNDYVKRILYYAMEGTATTLDVKLNMDSIYGQLRLDNVQVIRSPMQVIDEDPTNNVASFPIKLLVNPGQAVTLTASASVDDVNAAVKYSTVKSKAYTLSNLTVSELTFTTGNWNVEQNLTVTSNGNSTVDGDRRITFQIADPNIADPNIVPSLDYFNVFVIDDEVARVLLTGADNLQVGEKSAGPTASDTANFYLALSGLSPSNVVVTLSDDPNEVDITPDTLTFTPAEIVANTAKMITVKAIADDGPETLVHTTAISFAAAPEAGQPSNDYIDLFPTESVVVNVYDADCGSTDFESQILDVTGDCIVNTADFAELALRWLECYAPNVSGCIATH